MIMRVRVSVRGLVAVACDAYWYPSSKIAGDKKAFTVPRSALHNDYIVGVGEGGRVAASYRADP